MKKNAIGDKVPGDYQYDLSPTDGNANKIDPMDRNLKFADIPVQDVVKPYSDDSQGVRATAADSPAIPLPGKTGSAGSVLQAQQEVVNNPWFSQSSSLVDFMNVMSKLLLQQRQTHYTQGKLEIGLRAEMYAMGKENAQIAKDLKMKEAEEQYLQASLAFFNAGISAVQASQVMSNRGAAEREVQTEIDNKIVERDGPLNGAPPPPDDQARFAAQVENMEANRFTNVHKKIEQLNMRSQAVNETLKQTAQGFTSVMSALIKERQGELENLKQKREALLQSYNKYYDGTSKSKDDAKGSIDKLVDSITRTIADVNKAHQLGGRG